MTTAPVAGTATEQRASYRSLFAIGEFRALLACLFLFALGLEVEILGLSVLVYARTHSSVLAALAFSAGFAPQAASGVLLAALADRLPRAAISGSLLARAFPGLAIGLIPAVPVPVTMILVALAALVTPTFLASQAGLLPEILDGDRYVLGKSLFSLVAAGTQVAGLGLGGALLACLTARGLLVLAGASLAVAAVIMRFRLRPRPARAVATGSTVRATLSGNRELLASPGLRRLLARQWLPVWFAGGADALAVPYTESLGHPAAAASFLLAASPCGMLLGNLVVGRLCRPSVRERLVLPLSILTGAPLIAFAFRPPLPVAASLVFASGTGFAYLIGLQRAFAQAIPARLRGQGFGLASTGLMTGQGLFPGALGAAATALGPGGAIAAAGAAAVTGALAAGGRATVRRTTARRTTARGTGDRA